MMSFQIIVGLYLLFNVVAYGKRLYIVGGEDANIADISYAVSIRRLLNNEHICGGAIISNRHILTAAHCIQESTELQYELKIHVGTSHHSDPGNYFLCDRIFIHPDFEGLMKDTSLYNNDIAIIRIRGLIEFNNLQNKVNLPTEDIVNGDFSILSGWGVKNSSSTIASENLQKTWMIVYGNQLCHSIPFELGYDQFCAFQKEGVGPCAGDSGSPLVSNNVIIGVVSIGIPCATGVPDVYTRVYFHLDFIKSVLNIV